MDGVSTMDTGSSGAALFNMNTESIAEVKVLESGYQAEYGLRSGLQMLAVTKSGTNQFRGSLYNVRRNSDWNANSKTNILNGVPKTDLEGAGHRVLDRRPDREAGRPQQAVLLLRRGVQPRDRRRHAVRRSGCRPRWSGRAISRRPPTTSATRIRTSRIRKRLERARLLQPAITAAASRTAACSGRIPADRLYPLGLNILKMYPLPNNQSTTIGTNHQFIQPTYDTLLYQPALRLDYQVTPGLRVSFKYQGNNNAQARQLGSLPGWNDADRADSGKGHGSGDGQLQHQRVDVPRRHLRTRRQPAGRLRRASW